MYTPKQLSQVYAEICKEKMCGDRIYGKNIQIKFLYMSRAIHE